MEQSIPEWTKYKICGRQPLSRPYPLKYFKGCLPQILYLVHSSDYNSFLSYIFWIKVAILKCGMGT